MINPAQLTEIRQFVARFGPGNCWTGTVGQACAYLRLLLDELDSNGDALRSARHFIEKGVEPRMADQWPALAIALVSTKEKIDQALAAGDGAEPITDEWLEATGFSNKGINGWSILLPPRDEPCAIAELFVEGDHRGWYANIAQGVPDDPHVHDDIVSLTSLPEKLTRGHVRRLLRAMGVNS